MRKKRKVLHEILAREEEEATPQPVALKKVRRTFSISSEVDRSLRLLSWFLGRSDSAIVEEALRAFLEDKAALLEEAEKVSRRREEAMIRISE